MYFLHPYFPAYWSSSISTLQHQIENYPGKKTAYFQNVSTVTCFWQIIKNKQHKYKKKNWQENVGELGVTKLQHTLVFSSL